MKRAKMFLTAFAVVATVGSALAVKANFFGSGSVYCANTCSTMSRVDFRLNGLTTGNTNVCGTIGGVEKTEYIFDETDACTAVQAGKHYDAVGTGN